MTSKMSSEVELADEKWAPVPIENCLYEVSDTGRIRNSKGKIIKGREDHGYWMVRFRTGLKKPQTRSVHRMVAGAFIPNPRGLPCVNHKDGNRKNNRVENLEWVTSSENSFHSSRILGKTRPPKPVTQYDREGNFIASFESGKLASAATGIASKTIWANCNEVTVLGGGFMWKWGTKSETNCEIDLSLFVDVPGFDGYVVSKEGVIYSKKRRQLLSQCKDGAGYKRVVFHLHGKQYQLGVHEIVAMTYIPNPSNLPIINHKDHDRANNHVDNLERVTLSQNSRAAVIAGRIKSNPVQKFSPYGELLASYFSTEEAARENEISSWAIAHSCNNNRSRSDFIWSFDGADVTDRFIAKIALTPAPSGSGAKQICQYNKNGSFVGKHSSFVDAAKSVEGYDSGIRRCCNGIILTYKEYIWRYV